MSHQDWANAILSKPSPFTSLSYIKRQEIKGFVGRKAELAQLTMRLKEVLNAQRSFGFRISGSGGSGKSTLFGFFSQEIEDSYKNHSVDLFFQNYMIFPCFIDAPKGEKTTFRYIWQSIVNSLMGIYPHMNGEFFEVLAIKFIVKALKIIHEQFQDGAVAAIFEDLIPNFSEKIKKFSWDEVIQVPELYSNQRFFEPNFLPSCKAVISKYWRNFARMEVSLGNGQKRMFKPELRYIDVLFNTINANLAEATRALEMLKGTTTELLNSDKEIIGLLNWVTLTWEWILEKPICFTVGIDNLGYLTLDLPENENPYDHFIQTLLMMRDDLRNFLFVIIGTTDDWEAFDNYIKPRKDYPHQIAGFITHSLELDRLNRDEFLEAMRFLMQDFWSKAKLSPESMYYPFSKEFFSYLFDFRLHKFRDILNDLNFIWSQMQHNNRISLFTDPFEIVRFIPSQSEHFSSIEQFSPDTLIPYERQALIKQWESIISSFADRDRSKSVEEELTAFLEVLKEHEDPRQISLAQQCATLQYMEDGRVQTRYPDIFIQLFNPGTIDETHSFEIQVKIHNSNKNVSFEELKGSLGSLQHQKIDALLLLMTGPGLDNRVMEYIKENGLSPRIFNPNPINESQFVSLLFMVFYRKIMQKSPSVEIVICTLNKIFGQPWNDIINRIRNMSPYNFGEDLRRVATPPEKTGTLDGLVQKAKKALDADEKISEQPEQKSNLSENPSTNQNQENYSKENADNALSKTPTENFEDKEASGPISIVLKRYAPQEREVKLICGLALSRTDRFKGRVTKDYIKKNVPSELKEEQCRLVFDQLKKDASTKKETLFTFSGSSLIITELGEQYLKIINSC